MYSWPRGPSATRLISAPICCDQNGRRRRDHAGSGTAGDLDPPLLLQHEQRLAHGGPADSEARHELLLGRQMGADLELVGGDQRLELLGNVVSTLAPTDRQLAEQRRDVTASRDGALCTSRGLARGQQRVVGPNHPTSQPSVAPGAPCPDGRPFEVHGPSVNRIFCVNLLPQHPCARQEMPGAGRVHVQQAWPAHPEVPISKAVRAGDFVFTSAYGPWTFDPAKVDFDDTGDIVDDGSGLAGMPFDEQVHRTFGFVEAALTVAGCTFATSSSANAGLPTPGTSWRSTPSTAPTSHRIPRCARSFPSAFMFDCKIEMQAVAYRPVSARIATMAARMTQVVTFAAEPFRGNPAFVVSLERDTPSELLQAVAAQLGDGVVAVLGPQDGDVMRLRFDTAAGPHPGAGHAATAAAAVLLEDRSSVDVAFEDGTRRRFWRDDEHVVVPWPPMPFAACALGPTLGAALGRVPDLCLAAQFGYVAVYSDEDALRDMAPDMAALAELDRNAVIATAPGIDSDIVVRVFAPKVGIARGSGLRHRASDSLALLGERLGRKRLHSRHLSPRGGDLWCEFDGTTVTIAGQTCRFLEGELLLPGA